jgi:hypothetical protein
VQLTPADSSGTLYVSRTSCEQPGGGEEEEMRKERGKKERKKRVRQRRGDMNICYKSGLEEVARDIKTKPK